MSKPQPSSSAEQLLANLIRELYQTETSAVRHCRREASRLGDVPPAHAMRAISEHATATLPEWAELCTSRRARRPRRPAMAITVSEMEDAMTSAQSELQALLDSRVEACRARDVDRLMSLYSPNIVYFDCVPPLHFTGTDAVRRNFVRWFGEYEGEITLETHGLHIAISGDVAFVHMLHLDKGNTRLENGLKFWLRSTVCCQRSNGRWLISHEHISLPVRPGLWSTVLKDSAR